MTTTVYISRYRCLANGREFNKAGFGRDLSQEWGQKYYVTEDAEAAIMDLLNHTPAGMRELDMLVEQLWAETGPHDVLNGKAKVKQAAWRFFADLSPRGKLWYFERMLGSSVCGVLQMRQLGEIGTQLYVNADRIGPEEKLEVEVQSLQYTKWLSLRAEDKRRWMGFFLTMPVYYDIDTTDKPLVPHPFHPELGA